SGPTDGLPRSQARRAPRRRQSLGRRPRAVYAAVAAAGSVVRSLVPHRRSLEEVFLHAVTGGAGVGAGA
ncbi:MAG: hypothetical protein ACK58X_02745, partial [Planctomycetota bacterium]